MPLSNKDRELWLLHMKDAKPLHVKHTCLPTCSSNNSFNLKTHSNNHTWDMHGMTMDQAHELTLAQVHANHTSWKYMTFITGKSGLMTKEFAHWLSGNPHVSKVEPVNGGGAYRVWFRKTKK